MKKIIAIILSLCLIVVGVVACVNEPSVPIVGFYTTTENIEVVNIEDWSYNFGSDAVRYFRITVQITNTSDKDIHIDYDNFECSVDNGEIVNFIWDEEVMPDAMGSLTLHPEFSTTEYLYVKVPIDITYLRLGVHTNYDSAYFTLKTPSF
jgi:hypothetical protein